MDCSGSIRFDICEIYRRYCEIISGNVYAHGEKGYRGVDESERAKLSREALAELLTVVDTRVNSRDSIFGELHRLMSRLGLMGDSLEFSRFYNFVFFMCRENGQKNITVSVAITAWRLVLARRFRLLNQWCDFVEKNQRHNISEDTWCQVLAFSRCIQGNLEGYDPEGAWPVLIDEFVEHMYRVNGTNDSDCSCNCGDSEAQSCTFEDPLPGLRTFPGLKRKMLQGCELKLSNPCLYSPELFSFHKLKRARQTFVAHKPMNWMEENPPGVGSDDCMDMAKHSSPLSSTKSPCAIEGCLAKGFAGLFSTHSCLQLDQKRGVSFT